MLTNRTFSQRAYPPEGERFEHNNGGTADERRRIEEERRLDQNLRDAEDRAWRRGNTDEG